VLALLMSPIGSEGLIAYSECERKKKMKDFVVPRPRRHRHGIGAQAANLL
jgi:hypothetical protein